MKFWRSRSRGVPSKIFYFFSSQPLRNPIKGQKTGRSVTNDHRRPFKKIFKKVKKNLVRPQNLA
jgi:hypothetical protein